MFLSFETIEDFIFNILNYDDVMKKLKKIKLTKSIEDFIPLKEWELRTIVAGDGEPTWDCLFKSFICYYESMTGITLDQNELVDYYKSCTGRNPCAEGGADIESFISLMGAYGIQGSWGGQFGSYNNALAVIKPSEGSIYHVVIPVGAAPIYDSNGNIIDYAIYCKDPAATNNCETIVTYRHSQVQGYMDLEYFIGLDSPIDYGSSSFSWGSISPSYYG